MVEIPRGGGAAGGLLGRRFLPLRRGLLAAPALSGLVLPLRAPELSEPLLGVPVLMRVVFVALLRGSLAATLVLLVAFALHRLAPCLF